VTIEGGHGGSPEVHIHAGGQGIWVGRMAAVLGAEVTLCAALGGETGQVLRSLIADEAMTLRATKMQSPNTVYVHDRRGGTREEVARTAPPTLSRHEADDLYGAAISAAMACDAVILTAPQPQSLIDPGTYSRLARDIARNQITAVADLTGEHLREALSAGVRLVKVSADRLIKDGYAAGDSTAELRTGLARLRELGACDVVVSREDEPALALIGDRSVELVAPRLEAFDPQGTGDSQTAAMAYGLASGQTTEESLKLGMAAGALNVTRRGMGSGTKTDIEQLAHSVEVRPFDANH
jgi:1-phosphofructokinase